MSRTVITYNPNLEQAWGPLLTNRAWIEEVVAQPDANAILDSTNGSVEVLVKRVGGTGPLDVLVVGRRTTDGIEVWLALASPARLRDLLGAADPIRILEALAAKFGEPVRIGDRVASFFGPMELHYPEGRDVDVVRCDSEESFAVFAPFKIIGSGADRRVSISCAFAINLERYRAWRGLPPEQDDPPQEVECFIAEAMRGQMNARVLASYAGLGWMAVSFPTMSDGVFFRIACEGYELAAGIANQSLYIRRNGVEAAVSLKSLLTENAELRMAVGWTTNRLRVGVFNPQTKQEEAREVSTSVIRPPNRLLAWARRRAIARTEVYGTRGELYEAVAEAIESVQDVVSTTGMQPAFWDRERAGGSGRRPKIETDIHGTIEGLLWNIGLAKSLDIVREPLIAGGELDFLVTGYVTGLGSVPVCVEFKHAHSDQVFRGVEAQLPTYMNAKAAEFGIYSVLWFKGNEFGEPSQFDMGELKTELEARRLKTGLNIAILMLDLTKPLPPSKR